MTAAEQRSVENPEIPLTWERFAEVIGLGALSEAGVTVNIEAAMGVPAWWCGVNFLSRTMASLPLNVYRKDKRGRRALNTRVARLLHYNVNEEMSSFAWRKWKFEQLFNRGRAYTLIVRGEREPFRYLWPLETNKTKVKRLKDGRKVYEVTSGPHKGQHDQADIIDIALTLKDDGLQHYSPIEANKDTFGLAIAATRWGSRFFQNGGVPPFILTGPFLSPGGMTRAQQEMGEAIRKNAAKKENSLALPDGHTLETVGVDPEKMQHVELKRLLIEEFARILSLPPTFLQDLSHGTYSNTEQQDLHLVKHTIRGLVEQFEQELNLKLFGWERHDRYCEHNLDGLQRGDFKTRMEGYASALQNAGLTPNERRALENLPPLPGGDDLLIQGATVPLGSQPSINSNTPPAEE